MPQSFFAALDQVMHELYLGQKGLADITGSSRRTVQRWAAGKSSPYDFHVIKAACAVHARSPTHAALLAAAVGKTLVELGLEKPPAPPPAPAASPTVLIAAPPPPPPLDARHIVDSVVCAAANALQVVPQSVRPALLAAFTRARQLNLSLEAVEKALGEPGG